MKRIPILFVILISLFAADAIAQVKQRVRFPAGATGTTVSGTVRGYAYRDYIVGANAGQTISIQLTSSNTYTVFTVFQPNGDNLEGATEIDEFTGALPERGDYIVRVLMMRAGARRPGAVSNYKVKISIE
jgi:hypothetical protein